MLEKRKGEFRHDDYEWDQSERITDLNFHLNEVFQNHEHFRNYWQNYYLSSFLGPLSRMFYILHFCK